MFSGWSGLLLSRGWLRNLGVGILKLSVGWVARRKWFVGSTGGISQGEGRLQLVFCFSAKDKTVRLGLEGRREC